MNTDPFRELELAKETTRAAEQRAKLDAQYTVRYGIAALATVAAMGLMCLEPSIAWPLVFLVSAMAIINIVVLWLPGGRESRMAHRWVSTDAQGHKQIDTGGRDFVLKAPRVLVNPQRSGHGTTVQKVEIVADTPEKEQAIRRALPAYIRKLIEGLSRR